ncbi:MAG TPA: sensor histidine kinase [Bacillales bacterium]|nr:sensor histidine kinase [Bacillales bacterium]
MSSKIKILFSTFTLFFFFSLNVSANSIMLAQSGEMDVRNANPNELIALNGEWLYYWNKLLLPDELHQHQPTTMIPLPSQWSNFEYGDGKFIPGQGYGTFVLSLKIPERDVGKSMGVYIPTFNTAIELYIDGKLVGKVGEVGTSKETMKPKYIPEVFTFTPQSNKIEIVILNSNFHHLKGGVLGEILFGDALLVQNFKEKAVAKTSFLFGIFALISLYHLVVYLFRKSETRSLAFSLVSLDIAIRTLLTDQALLIRIFPEFGWTLALKIEYLTIFTGFFLYIIFLKTLYPKEWNLFIYRLSLFITGLFSLAVVITPPTTFTHLLKPFTFIAIMLLVYFFYIMFVAMIRKREGAVLNFSTCVFFYVTILNDVLYYNEYIKSFDMVSMGFFIFLFSQFIILTREYAKSFQETDRLNALLVESNTKLEERVISQTESLAQSMKETAIALSEKMMLEERNRLVGEIHDTVGHTLTTINIQIEAGKRLIQNKPTEAVEKLERSQEQIRVGLNEIRNSLRLLKDDKTNVSDYLFSIKNLILNTEKNTGVVINSLINVTKPLSSKKQDLLYRALQEGLTNGIRHGKSSHFDFFLYESSDYLIFKLEDDGEGADEIQLGLGLTMMRSRVKEFNGEIYIESKKRQGFTIEICLPCE